MNPLASTQPVRRVLTLISALALIALSAACGSGNSPTPNSGGFTNSNLSGTYVVSIAGTDITGNGSFFAIAGTISADGKGNISGGTLDINDFALGGTGIFAAQTVSASTYSISSDGRGTGKIVTPALTFGIDFVLTSDSHGLITRFDGLGSGSGTLDLQGSATQTSLTSLAFSVSGADSSESPLASVGAFTLNPSGAITSGSQDFNDAGSSAGLTALPLTGSLTLTSSTSGTAQLNSTFGSLGFDVWVIDSTHLKLIETDATGLALSGDAFTQQTTFTAGQLVFTIAGFDSSQNPFVAGGFATTDVNGNLSAGVEDYNDAGTANTVPSFTGSCTTFVAGRCVLALTGFSNGVFGNFVFAAYPSSGGVQLLEIDSLGITSGAAYPQTATSFASSAGYGLNLTGSNINGEVDDIAQFDATSTNVTGILDENDISGPAGNIPLSGTYLPDSPATGRGSITVPTIGTLIGTLNLQYYTVSSSTALVIEVDGEQATVGTFELQSSAGGAVAQSHMAIMHPIVHPHGALKRKSK